MKKLFILFLLIVCFSGNVFSQKIKIITATKQSWSGGMAGHSGINYNIVLKSFSDNIVLDSVYINNIGTKLDFNVNVLIDSLKHTFTIIAGESQIESRSPEVSKSTDSTTTPPIRKFVGDALILYTYKKKHFSLIIANLKSLPPLAFP